MPGFEAGIRSMIRVVPNEAWTGLLFTALLIEQLLNGLQLGVMLFLMAAGLTLIFGVMGLINLAHGSLYMIGAFACATVAAATGSFWIGLIASLAAAAGVGAIIEVAVIRRLYDRDHLDQVLATFALILVLSEGARWLFGSFPLYLDIPPVLQGAVPLPGGGQYQLYRLAIIGVGIAVAIGLYLLISRTRLGMRIRAGESDREMIGALGVDIGTLYTVVFALGAALAGLAGALVGALQSVQVGMGEPVLILAFVVIVIGGIGSIKGALVGAIIVGVVDTMGRFLLPSLLALTMPASQATTIGAAVASMLIYVVMALILAFRPSGLFAAQS
ncbi:branched-chain amino acid transport system permease protein [Ensifer sp. LBL]